MKGLFFSSQPQFLHENLRKWCAIDSVFQNLVKFWYTEMHTKVVGEKHEESVTLTIELFYRQYANLRHIDRYMSSLRRTTNHNTPSPECRLQKRYMKPGQSLFSLFFQRPRYLSLAALPLVYGTCSLSRSIPQTKKAKERQLAVIFTCQSYYSYSQKLVQTVP